jgi:hypothetical protein
MTSLDRLPGQASVDMFRRLSLLRRDPVPAGGQTLDIHETALEGSQPESRRLGFDHEASWNCLRATLRHHSGEVRSAAHSNILRQPSQ